MKNEELTKEFEKATSTILKCEQRIAAQEQCIITQRDVIEGFNNVIKKYETLVTSILKTNRDNIEKEYLKKVK